MVGHSIGSAEAALVASQRPVALLVYLCPRLGSFPVGDEAPGVFREGFPFPPKDDEGRMACNSAPPSTRYIRAWHQAPPRNSHRGCGRVHSPRATTR